MKGWNDNGELVDFANRCNECGHSMPLPEKAGKKCPKCGTVVPVIKLQKPVENI